MQAQEKMAPEIREAVARIETKGSSADREVLCPYCSEWVDRTLPPHLRKEHPEEWNTWKAEFLSLAKKGYSNRKIMHAFGRIFTWSVIETELKKTVEARGEHLPIRPAGFPRRWEPKEEPDTDTTIWAFPQRGTWAVHSPDYRGNWSPYVPRTLIKRYSRGAQIVCDPFVGGGTTLIECALLGRRGVGFDVSPHATALASHRLREMRHAASQSFHDLPGVDVDVVRGDARFLPLRDNSVDLICTHPPYGPAIRYTATVDADLSRLSPEKFEEELPVVARELHRVLKPRRVCAVLIGDFRSKGRIIPFGWQLFTAFSQYFDPQDIVIKEQHQDSSSEFYYRDLKKRRVLRIRHEYLFVLRNKPDASSRG